LAPLGRDVADSRQAQAADRRDRGCMLAADGAITNETHSNRGSSRPASGDEDKTADQLLEGRAPVVMETEVNEPPRAELTLIPDDLLRVAPARAQEDRKSTRLNSSHQIIS